MTWTVGEQWSTYTRWVNKDVTLAADDFEIKFPNDCYQPPQDRNLWVDYLEVDGQRHQTEDPSTYGNAWNSADGCSWGHKQSQVLACAGSVYFEPF